MKWSAFVNSLFGDFRVGKCNTTVGEEVIFLTSGWRIAYDCGKRHFHSAQNIRNLWNACCLFREVSVVMMWWESQLPVSFFFKRFRFKLDGLKSGFFLVCFRWQMWQAFEKKKLRKSHWKKIVFLVINLCFIHLFFNIFFFSRGFIPGADLKVMLFNKWI